MTEKVVIYFDKQNKHYDWLDQKQKNLVAYLKAMKDFPFLGVAGEKINLNTKKFLQERWDFFEEMQSSNFEKKPENIAKIRNFSYHLKFWIVMSNQYKLLNKYKAYLYNLDTNKDSYKYSHSVYSVFIHAQQSLFEKTQLEYPKISLLLLSCLHADSDTLNFLLKYEKSLYSKDIIEIDYFDLLMKPMANKVIICERPDFLFKCLKAGGLPRNLSQLQLIQQVLEKAKSSSDKEVLIDFALKKEYPFHNCDEEFYKFLEKVKLKDQITVNTKVNKILKL